MPSFDIVKESSFEKTFRNESVIGQFDLKIKNIKERFTGNIDIENRDWQIGIIVGSSGSGKSTVAREMFSDGYICEHEYGGKSVLDEMPKGKKVTDITRTFNSVGFATAWSWLKPYHVLSNGEKMRVDIAKSLLSDDEVICFDEFTSVVDRTVARTSSYAIQKAIRKTDRKFVAVSCHYDIIDWLEPDWIYDMNEGRFFFAREKRRDQKLSSKYLKQKLMTGKCLKSFTI
jgi:ABC-type ATPase with predicted acetyltransferase domain